MHPSIYVHWWPLWKSTVWEAQISYIHIWSKAAGNFKIKACGLTRVSTAPILRIWDEERAILVNDGTSTSNSDCTSARQLSQADLSFIYYYISDCHKRGGTVTINFIQAALAGPLRGDIVDYLRMHGCKQLKVELDDGRIMYHEVADDRLKSRDKQFISNMGVSQGSRISLVSRKLTGDVWIEFSP